MSETPRTNKKQFDVMPYSLNGQVFANKVVMADDMRQLETELAEAEKKVFAYKTALELAESELAEARAEIERLRGVIISQITPEPFVLSSYSATTEPAKDERDKLIEQMRALLNAVVARSYYIDCADIGGKNWFDARDAALAAERGE